MKLTVIFLILCTAATVVDAQCYTVCSPVELASGFCFAAGSEGTLVPTCMCPGGLNFVGQCPPNATAPTYAPTNYNTYMWGYAPWNECSAPCGGGVQNTTVGCYYSYPGGALGRSTQTSDCTSYIGAAPATKRACNTHACGMAAPPAFSDSFQYPGVLPSCAVYPPNAWTYAYLNNCPGCGGGVQNRAVGCTDPTTGYVANSACCLTPKPLATPVNCSSPACYRWSVGSYGPCSSVCNGQQVGSATCVYYINETPSAASYCSGLAPAVLTVPCNPDSCGWRAAGWSACSANCGGGTQERNVTCVNPTENAVVNASYCAGIMPTTSQACNQGSCAVPTTASPTTTAPATTTAPTTTAPATTTASATTMPPPANATMGMAAVTYTPPTSLLTAQQQDIIIGVSVGSGVLTIIYTLYKFRNKCKEVKKKKTESRDYNSVVELGPSPPSSAKSSALNAI